MLERGDNGRQQMERERTAIGSLYCRIQVVKSGAVMKQQFVAWFDLNPLLVLLA